MSARRTIKNILVVPQLKTFFKILAIMLIIGTFLYHFIEGWSYIDSLYFSAMSIFTVGYGDLAPQTDLGKIVSIFYVISGVTMVLVFVNVIAIQAFKDEVISKCAPVFDFETEDKGKKKQPKK
jgi:voltage-gated potassium channel Kch